MPDRSRREKLEAMLADNPTDTFLRYGLAMELAREGDSAGAVATLRQLIADESQYGPAYFQAAQILFREGESAEAAEFLRSGIAVARSQGDQHAVEEMTGFLNQIESESAES